MVLIACLLSYVYSGSIACACVSIYEFNHVIPCFSLALRIYQVLYLK